MLGSGGGNLRDSEHLKGLGTEDDITILKEILMNRPGWCRLHRPGSREGQVADTNKCGN
jgi:hypothetical protein